MLIELTENEIQNIGVCLTLTAKMSQIGDMEMLYLINLKQRLLQQAADAAVPDEPEDGTVGELPPPQRELRNAE